MKRHKQMPTNKEEYLRLQALSGLGVRDRVMVTAHAESLSRGWATCWVPPMTRNIGKTGTIIEGGNDNPIGFAVAIEGSEPWWYPYFVLRKVEP